jgi:GNAT superfamily N-acetyltransferase
MKNISISLNPTEKDFESTEKWLYEESLADGDSFYCNFHTITTAYKNSEFATFYDEGKLVGFITWRDVEIHIHIEIMSVKLEYRKKGLGRLCYIEFERATIESGFKAIQLFCSPRESRFFWQKMNFLEFPVIGGLPDLSFYKLLIEVNPSLDYKDNLVNKLELWDVESINKERFSPKWTWNLSLLPSLPILTPCNGDWNLKWTENGIVVKESKMKRFQKRESNRIDYYSFVYITHLEK